MRLIEYDETYYDKLKHYQLSEEQLYFTGQPLENIQQQRENRNHPMLLLNDDAEIVTYFGLQEIHEFSNYYPHQQTMLLRSYSTDLKYLRKGYGKISLSLLPDFLQRHYPETEAVVLAVNEKNKAAQKLYEHGGFIDSGLRINGKKGVLKIMELSLK